MARSHRYLEAFKESYNAVGLASAAALSIALLNPFPLLVGVVAEAAYLLTVPDSKWYADRLARRFDGEVEARRKRLKDTTLPTLRPEVQARFAHLEEMRRQIDAQSQADKAWFREVLRKLDYLLEKFLVFAGKEAQFREYLASLREEVQAERVRSQHPARSADGFDGFNRKARRERGSDSPLRLVGPETDGAKRAGGGNADDHWTQQAVEEVRAHYAEQQQDLTESLKAESDDDTRAVLQKRLDILQRRDEFAGKIGKILTNINHQLQLTEDTFGLINDEIRARSPEQILSDIEEVVFATNTMATALEELAPIEQMAARVGE